MYPTSITAYAAVTVNVVHSYGKRTYHSYNLKLAAEIKAVRRRNKEAANMQCCVRQKTQEEFGTRRTQLLYVCYRDCIYINAVNLKIQYIFIFFIDNFTILYY